MSEKPMPDLVLTVPLMAWHDFVTALQAYEANRGNFQRGQLANAAKALRVAMKDIRPATAEPTKQQEATR